ncbi:hypothetical protein RAA17_02920 [Komagataeibacter rhaeticus]|nr:hypothetical protein [Komagataeibacter rhaeticus]
MAAGRRLTYLDNAALGLARVDMRGWRAGEGPDSYLYHVTQRDEMETIQARGTILFSPRAAGADRTPRCRAMACKHDGSHGTGHDCGP